MKLASAWLMTALAAVAVTYAGGAGEPGAKAQVRADMADALPAGVPVDAPRVSLVSFDATEAAPPAQGEQAAPPAQGAQAAQAFPPQPLDDQLTYLRQMVTQLKEENAQLGVLDLQVGALRQQVAEQEWEAQAEAADQSAQHAATLEALDMLRDAEARLQIGDWEGVDDELAAAETALYGRTRLEVDAAREALAREDLYPARQHIAAALAQRRLQR
jgi:hypothetical protein